MRYANYSLNFEIDSYVDRENAYANLGDNIQVLAIDYLYSKMGINKDDITYINIDGTRDYKGKYVILPAVTQFIDSNLDKRFPMSNNIIPFFISFLSYGDLFAERPELVQYMKKYEPIGCRDESTMLLCRKYGIESYLMGCVSLCFPKRDIVPKKEKVFAVDVSQALVKHIPEEILCKTEFLTHAVQYEEYPISSKENKRLMELAKGMLRKYYDEATMVITGRLHVAVPCIAMGIPVIFAADNVDFRFGWVDKLIKLYTLKEYDQIDWKPQSIDIEEIKAKIYNIFANSIKRLQNKYEDFVDVSEFYEDRNRTEYYGIFYERVRQLELKEDFEYIIWGAGHHGNYTYDIVKNIFPKAKLVSVVDKYKVGKFHGVSIIKPEEVFQKRFDHAFITTVPGKNEAISTLTLMGKEQNCTMITSQMLS